MYLARRGPVYPAKDAESEPLCGECGKRPAAWGDWMCEHCRRQYDAVIYKAQNGELLCRQCHIRPLAPGGRLCTKCRILEQGQSPDI